MADDDIERLLREVDALESGSTGQVVPRSTSEVAPAAERGRVGRAVRTGLVSGVVCGPVVGTATLLFAWLPFIDNPISSGLGAFVGAFLTGTALGWRRK